MFKPSAVQTTAHPAGRFWLSAARPVLEGRVLIKPHATLGKDGCNKCEAQYEKYVESGEKGSRVLTDDDAGESYQLAGPAELCGFANTLHLS